MSGVWRVSLQRMRADWPIVAAAWSITILAAVLFAAGVIYPGAAAEAGLQRALRDAPVASRSLEVARYDRPTSAADLDDKVGAAVQDIVSGPAGFVVRDWRSSATLALAVRAGSKQGDQAEVGFLDGLADHATLIAGAWPDDAPGPTSPETQVVLAQPAATALGLSVGDVVQAVARPGSQERKVALRVVGIYTPAEPAAAYWNQDDQLRTGLHDNGQYATFGPFLTSRLQLMTLLGDDELDLRWRVFPDFDHLGVDNAGPLARSIDSIAGRLLNTTGQTFTVTSGLAAILRDADRSLLVSRTSVVLLMAQLALLAGYAIVLMATLLVDHRRADTALLRARGAGSGEVAFLAFVEALVFAVSAAIIAPTLALLAVGIFNVVGPLADVGLRLEPRITPEAYAAAAAAGLLCVILLVLPAALSARAFAQEEGGKSRQETRTFGQRLGLDMVLLAITGIALWQLRLYGAPLTRSVQGQLGLDPLLVAAPAIGLVAGGVLALRLLPLLAQIVERTVSRGRGLLTSLGARQLARRPLRYTRSALLLVLAVSMGVFALSYAATWAGSQEDQATYQAGADLRMPAAATTEGLPTWALAGALADLPDVAATTPVERIVDGVKFAASGSADLLMLDARTAADIIRLRSDSSATPFPDLVDALGAARPSPNLPPLPDGTTAVRITPASTVAMAGQFVYDPEIDDGRTDPVDPATVAVQMRATLVIRDVHGLLYEFRSPLMPVHGPDAAPDAAIVIPLRVGGGTGVALHLDGPLSIASLGAEIWLPDSLIVSAGAFGIEAVGAGPADTGPWTDVPLDGAGPWSAGRGFGHQALEDVPGALVQGTTLAFEETDQTQQLFGSGTSQPTIVLGFLPNGIDATGGAVPIIANRAFLEAFDAEVGDVVTASISGRFSRLSIAGVMERFPTTDPARPLVIADEATVGLLRLRTVTPVRPVDEWWLSVTPGRATAVADALAAAPFGRTGVVSAEGRARALSTDPVALGIIGALTLGFVTTGLFAIVGLTVSAGVSARQQRTEFALLRALGLSGRQLSGSLWLEHGSVVVLGLLTGTGLGLLIAWLVLPFVTVTQGGVAPVPAVIIEVPWDRVLALDLASAAALGFAVLVIGATLRRLRVGATLRMGED